MDLARVWERRHTSAGSTYVGSWYGVAPHFIKTFAVRSSQGGSFHWVVAMAGTQVGTNARFTGTYVSKRLRQGSADFFSSREAFRYVKPVVVVGSVAPSGKGTLDVALSRQV